MIPAHVERRHLAIAASGCVALAAVAVVDPSKTTLTPPCPLRALTGLDCPLCGATRATHALTRGDVLAALDFNAFYVVLLPIVIVAVALWLVRGRTPAIVRRPSFAPVLLGAAIAFAVVRNLPFAPFSVLGT